MHLAEPCVYHKVQRPFENNKASFYSSAHLLKIIFQAHGNVNRDVHNG